jgi:hypothetical protein
MTMHVKYRTFLPAAMAWALLAASAPAFAATETDGTHDGTVVTLSGDKLVMTSVNGEELSHTLAPDAKLTLDGKPCMANDLKAGTKIRVTAQAAEKSIATRIEGIDKNREFASFRHDGKLVSLNADKLVMTGAPGEDDQACIVIANVKVTLDGKICKAEDLKPGMRIRVTAAKDDPFAATWIEALDKNLGFANP